MIIKYIMLLALFCLCGYLGIRLSKKYVDRYEELLEYKNILNVIEAKIRFTYTPLAEVFRETSNMKEINKNVKSVLTQTYINMKSNNASYSWNKALDEENTNLKEEDKDTLKMLSKLLGQTDLEGQLSQIELTKQMLEKNIKSAEISKNKNEKLFQKLGAILGLVVVIILF